MLDTRTEAERAAQLQFADAAQWEYEDEYDDSYDDLAPFGNDGVADVQGIICCDLALTSSTQRQCNVCFMIPAMQARPILHYCLCMSFCHTKWPMHLDEP